MKSLRLHQSINDPQYFCATEGNNMTVSGELFLRNLIREYATHRSDSYSLFVQDLPRYEKILLLSYCIGGDELEWASEDSHRLDTIISENTRDMQAAIDDVIDSVYHEDMQEMGLVLCHHQDNGEHFYSKR